MRPEIDDQIDAVARAMTSRAAPVHLTARVLARAFDRGGAGWRWWSWRLVVVPALMVIAVVVVRFAWRDAPRGLTPTPHVATVLHEPQLRSAQGPENRLAATGPASPASAAVRSMRTAGRPSSAPPSEDDTDLTLAPLTLEPMRVPALERPEPAAPESIGVAPLTLTPLPSEGR